MPIFLLVYGALLLLNAWDNRREFQRHPDKAQRYHALPLRYKLVCGLVVMPLLAATSFHGGFGFLGLVGLLCLEGACMRWYRKAGLLRP